MIFFLEKKISPLKRPFFKISDTKNDSRKKVKKLPVLKIKKCFKLSEVMVGSGIRKKPIPDPGSGGQKGTGSRIRNTGEKFSCEVKYRVSKVVAGRVSGSERKEHNTAENQSKNLVQ